MIVQYIDDPIPSPESVVGDDDYDTHSMKKRRLFGKISEGVLHVMKDNTKTIVIAMNEDEPRENAQHLKTMDREDARHIKTLEFENRRITSTEETSRGYMEAFKSIGDGLSSISQSF